MSTNSKSYIINNISNSRQNKPKPDIKVKPHDKTSKPTPKLTPKSTESTQSTDPTGSVEPLQEPSAVKSIKSAELSQTQPTSGDSVLDNLVQELQGVQDLKKRCRSQDKVLDKALAEKQALQALIDKQKQKLIKQQKVIEALQKKVSEAPKAAAVKDIIRVKQLKTETVLLKKKLDANKDETARLKSKVESQFQENQELKRLNEAKSEANAILKKQVLEAQESAKQSAKHSRLNEGLKKQIKKLEQAREANKTKFDDELLKVTAKAQSVARNDFSNELYRLQGENSQLTIEKGCLMSNYGRIDKALQSIGVCDEKKKHISSMQYLLNVPKRVDKLVNQIKHLHCMFPSKSKDDIICADDTIDRVTKVVYAFREYFARYQMRFKRLYLLRSLKYIDDDKMTILQENLELTINDIKKKYKESTKILDLVADDLEKLMTTVENTTITFNPLQNKAAMIVFCKSLALFNQKLHECIQLKDAHCIDIKATANKGKDNSCENSYDQIDGGMDMEISELVRSIPIDMSRELFKDIERFLSLDDAAVERMYIACGCQLRRIKECVLTRCSKKHAAKVTQLYNLSQIATTMVIMRENNPALKNLMLQADDPKAQITINFAEQNEETKWLFPKLSNKYFSLIFCNENLLTNAENGMNTIWNQAKAIAKKLEEEGKVELAD